LANFSVPRLGEKKKRTVLVEILGRKKLEELGTEGAIISKYIFKDKFYGQHELHFFDTNHRNWEVDEIRNNGSGTR